MPRSFADMMSDGLLAGERRQPRERHGDECGQE